MCIALLTTAHPDYALILINNRDEFILRPTSRPHWWHAPHKSSSAPSDKQPPILSSRDLLREERGTWLGISRDGMLAVLTNYRDTDVNATHVVHGTRSRGGIVVDWLAGEQYGEDRGYQDDAGKREEADSPQRKSTTEEAVKKFLGEEGLSNCGGFSMVCGRLRLRKHENGDKTIEPLAVLSNRLGAEDSIPWIAGSCGSTRGLSNTSYSDPDRWPKITTGETTLSAAVTSSAGLSEPELIERLFAVLDNNTLPLPPAQSISIWDAVRSLKHSIFIPAIGDEPHRSAMAEAAIKGTETWDVEATHYKDDEKEGGMGFEKGLYGTQRQTVVLVGWDGEVTYVERALWDANGQEIARGEGDVVVRFRIEGWEGGDPERAK